MLFIYLVLYTGMCFLHFVHPAYIRGTTLDITNASTNLREKGV